MVSIRINGTDSPIEASSLPRFTDLIELVRASIDPDHMITDIRLNGEDLAEDDWKKTPRSFGTSVIDISTDTPDRYVTIRLLEAPEVVQACYVQFRNARKTFQQGDSTRGNQRLAKAVDTLRSFFEWYGTMLQIMTSQQKERFSIDGKTRVICDICNTICQQQLHQSWWALSETIERDLEPRIDELETFCRKFEIDLQH